MEDEEKEGEIIVRIKQRQKREWEVRKLRYRKGGGRERVRRR